VESIPGGGLLVNVNDNCVLVFMPLPFFVCAPGAKPANGDLFEHLHDPSPAGDWNAPNDLVQLPGIAAVRSHPALLSSVGTNLYLDR